MLKILQARLQQYMNCEIPDVQAGFRKGRGTRDQIANICWIMEKAESSRNPSTSVLLTTVKPHHQLNGHEFGWTSGVGNRHREAWHAVIHDVAKSQTWLSDWTELNWTEALDCVGHNTQWKGLKEMGIPDHLTCLLRNLKQQLELDMEKQTGPKSGKEYIKAVYCHPAYLTYTLSTSREMLGWRSYKMESR